MVVVDGARKMINKTIDITVTSVHQTTAGKMIFGRFDDRSAGQSVSQPTAVLSDPGIRPSAVTETRSTEAQPGGERPPRPLSPDPSRS